MHDVSQEDMSLLQAVEEQLLVGSSTYIILYIYIHVHVRVLLHTILHLVSFFDLLKKVTTEIKESVFIEVSSPFQGVKCIVFVNL